MRPPLFREAALAATTELPGSTPFEGRWPLWARWFVPLLAAALPIVPALAWLAYRPSQQAYGRWSEGDGRCARALFEVGTNRRTTIDVSVPVRLIWSRPGQQRPRSAEGQIVSVRRLAAINAGAQDRYELIVEVTGRCEHPEQTSTVTATLIPRRPPLRDAVARVFAFDGATP